MASAGLAGLFGGIAQGMQTGMQLQQHREQMDLQKEQMRIQQEAAQRDAAIQSRQQMAKALETYDKIVNVVPDEQKPIAIKAWITSVEQVSKTKLTPEIKQALLTAGPDMSKMLTQAFIDNPDIQGDNLGQVLNNEALIGMMVSHGVKQQTEQQTQQLQQAGMAALQGPEGGPAATPENTAGLRAKAGRLEQLLANPNLPKEQRASFEKILEATNQQLGSSVDDKSQILTIARELQLDPANPAHMGLIQKTMMERATQQANAQEIGRQNAQPIDLATARATGVSPFMNRGEVRSMPGAGNVEVMTEPQLEGAKEGAKQNAQPLDLSLARETGLNPLQTRGEARKAFGSEGVELPSDATKTLANEQAKTTAEGFKAYAVSGRDAGARMPVRDQLRALLPHATTGMGAQQRAQLDRVGSMLGLKTEGLAATQVVDMISKQLALANRKDMPGALSDADREFLVNTEPNITKEKNAIYIRLDMDDIIDKRLQDRAAAIPAYQRKCGANGQFCENKTFDEVWAEFTDKNPLKPKFEAVMKKHGYQQPGKAKAPAAKAAPAAPAAQRGGASGDWDRAPAGGTPAAKPTAANPPVMTPEQLSEIEGEDGYLEKVKRQFFNSLKF